MTGPIGGWGETRQRLVSAALDLFAEHGVGGTSLQMIATRIGVTKAGVYRHFRAKEDIVLAALEPVFAQLGSFLDEAEAQSDRRAQIDVALEGLVDLVVDQGHLAAVLQGDPMVRAVVADRAAFHTQFDRLYAILGGPAPDATRRVNIAMVGGGLLFSGIAPELRSMPRQELREKLLIAARRLLDADGSHARGHSAAAHPDQGHRKAHIDSV